MDSTCRYCYTRLPTVQGLRSHLAQSKLCRQKQFEEYTAAESSSGSESDNKSANGLNPSSAGEAVDADYYAYDEHSDEGEAIDPPRPELPERSLPGADPAPSPVGAARQKRMRATVEEVEDEDVRWVQSFSVDQKAGLTRGKCETEFEKMRAAQKEKGHAPWEPFESQDEWELANWLMTSGLSHRKTDEYLKLKTVREGINPSFHNARAFLKRIDALPEGPKWTCYPFELVGDEMWCRDPVECVRELVGNTTFKTQAYEPCRIFKTFVGGKYGNREINEMWTADWWWEIQKLLPEGATLVPIILASDKTQLTRFSGDQQAWPVAGREGVTMDCADGFVRRMYLILSAYIADYPEQCLVCCCCTCSPKCRGDATHAPWRCPAETLAILADQASGDYPAEFVNQHLRAINPFWADLPHCDIFRCMTPDLLHELHNGVFGDHIVKWATSTMRGGKDEVDRRFRAMTPHPSLRHFKKGISLTTQWTGTERKNMEKVFLGILANATEPRVQLACRGVLDFIHYAHFETHCDESLLELDAAWLAFHNNKDIFVDLEVRTHFNISKVHKLKHYVDSIRSKGTADGFNSEGTERLHIDLAKVGYNATNKKAYTRQMTVWLRRQESVHKFGSYLQWAVPNYVVPMDGDSDPEEAETEEDDEPVDANKDRADADEDLDLDDEGELEVVPSGPAFTVAKKPAFPHLTAASLATDFHAPAFLDNLDDFLHSKSITPPFVPADNSTFPVYKRLSLSLPRIPEAISSDLRDTVRAIKGSPLQMTAKGVKPAKAGQFDTVLVRVSPRRVNEGPTDGLCVARVRVIFRIPAEFGPYPDPVAYVDWYKPLQKPVPGLDMHLVSLSSRNLRQRSSIISVQDIVRSCHLIPVFGRAVDPGWTSNSVLDLCKSFYLNPYLRHHDFYLFRYLDLPHHKGELPGAINGYEATAISYRRYQTGISQA
ncbi:hypothetical protein K438DRAFT_1913726 [Mycena galopus ATCC 62051]|nr:hypothetical protein K438DRAFT_1913726 [Mycena galopus ATCC 62051]